MGFKSEVVTDGVFVCLARQGWLVGVALVLQDLWLFFVAWPPREFNTQSGYKSNSSFDHVSGSSHLMVSGSHFAWFNWDNSLEYLSWTGSGSWATTGIKCQSL